MRPTSPLLAALLCAIPLFAAESPIPTLKTTGSIETIIDADRAGFSFTIQTKGAKLSEAVAKGRQTASKIVSSLSEIGVPASDVSIGHFYTGEEYRRGFLIGAKDYSITLTVAVETGRLDLIEPAIFTVFESNAMSVSGVTFSLRNFEEAKFNTLKQAAEKARKKAEMLATAAGARLGRVMKLNESSPYRQTYYPNPFNAVYSPTRNEEEGDYGISDIFHQAMKISASVEIEYELLP